MHQAIRGCAVATTFFLLLLSLLLWPRDGGLIPGMRNNGRSSFSNDDALLSSNQHDNYKNEGPELSRPRLCLGASLHNEAETLPEWMEFYLAQGVDFFCLAVDPRSTDDTLQILKFYESLGVADVRAPPSVRSIQDILKERMKAIDRCLLKYDCEWIMTADSDEWTYPNPLFSGYRSNMTLRDFLVNERLRHPSKNISRRGIWGLQWMVTKPQPFFEVSPSLVNAFFSEAFPGPEVKGLIHRSCLKGNRWTKNEHMSANVLSGQSLDGNFYCPTNNEGMLEHMRRTDLDSKGRSNLPFVALHSLSRSRMGFRQRQKRLEAYAPGVWSSQSFWDWTTTSGAARVDQWQIPHEFKKHIVRHIYRAYKYRRNQLQWYCSSPGVFFYWSRCKSRFPYGADVSSLRLHDQRLSSLDELILRPSHRANDEINSSTTSSSKSGHLTPVEKLRALALCPKMLLFLDGGKKRGFSLSGSTDPTRYLPLVFRKAEEVASLYDKVVTAATAFHTQGKKTSVQVVASCADISPEESFVGVRVLIRLFSLLFEGVPGVEVLLAPSNPSCGDSSPLSSSPVQCTLHAFNQTDRNPHCNNPIGLVKLPVVGGFQEEEGAERKAEGFITTTTAATSVVAVADLASIGEIGGRAGGQESVSLKKFCQTVLADGDCRRAALF